MSVCLLLLEACLCAAGVGGGGRRGRGGGGCAHRFQGHLCVSATLSAGPGAQMASVNVC